MANLTEIQHLSSLSKIFLDIDKSKGERITRDSIAAAVHRAATTIGISELDAAEIIRKVIHQIESNMNVQMGEFHSLSDDSDHQDWSEEFTNLKWPFWSRYLRFQATKNLPSEALESLTKSTENILMKLESPNRKGSWDRRGLVAGDVQSGKTANYIGLACRAIDSGYKLIVILAGVHNSLRSQTQLRVDEGILGFDSRQILRFDRASSQEKRGVGKLHEELYHVNSFTSADESGDFTTRKAEGNNVPLGAVPTVMVVKKNATVLRNLVSWATFGQGEVDPVSGKNRVPKVPLLVIDDEADHASIDTRKYFTNRDRNSEDPTTINKLIRELLEAFEQSAYVGYTATPFANIFIPQDIDHEDFGADLFPSGFIVQLPTPTNYLGPKRVFGLKEDLQVGIDVVDPISVVEDVNDSEKWLPETHKSSFRITSNLPMSLKRAILTFLVSNGVRAFRGVEMNPHRTMLVHVSRFTKVQKQVADQVSDYLDELRQAILYGIDENQDLQNEINEILAEMKQVSTEVSELPELKSQVSIVPEFKEVLETIQEESKRAQVQIFNGKSIDALQYEDNPDGLIVIAIGGDKLSRGLTLEGLSVSYYLRATKMYDTLMQMGRWFGYRPGYLDTCRLFTQPRLKYWYELVTSASEELRQEFLLMESMRATPKEFGLRVRQHPDGLLVSSPTKIRTAKSLSLSYSATAPEPTKFSLDFHQQNQNLSALEWLIKNIEKAAPLVHGGSLRWDDISPNVVTEFLSKVSIDPSNLKVQPKALIDYIASRNKLSPKELTNWTVVLGGSKSGTPIQISKQNIGLTERSMKYVDLNAKEWAAKRITDPKDALILSRNDSKSEPDERLTRNPERGLLVVYPFIGKDAGKKLKNRSANDGKNSKEREKISEIPFLSIYISFPKSSSSELIDYKVTDLFYKQYVIPFEGLDEDDD